MDITALPRLIWEFVVYLFLAADLIVRRVFRVRAAKPVISELATVTQTWAGGAPPAEPS